MATTRDDFEEVEILRDETGVCAVISRNKHTGFYSYGFFKEYEKAGERRRSTFLNRRHSLGIRRLIHRVDQYLDPRIDRDMASRV